MNSKVQIYEVPVASTSFTTEADLYPTNDGVMIRYAYKRDGMVYASGIRFRHVLATRTRREMLHSMAHQIRVRYLG